MAATAQLEAAAVAAPEPTTPVAGEAPPASKPRLLMLTHRLPYPPDRGDRIRTYHMLRVLSRSFEVSLASTSEDPVWLQHHQLVRSVAKQAFIQPISSRYGRIKGLASLLAGKAVTPAAYYRQGIADQVLQWHERAPFDAVLTVCTSMVRYAELLERLPSHVKVPAGTLRPLHVMDLMDVDSEKWAAYAADSRWPMSWVYRAESARLRRIEAGRSHHFDAITVVSEAEAQAYRQLVSSTQPVHAVSNGVDMDYFHAMPDAPTTNLVFVGVLNYKPNSDGVAWFAENVMPGLRERVPGATFQIIGRHPTPRSGFTIWSGSPGSPGGLWTPLPWWRWCRSCRSTPTARSIAPRCWNSPLHKTASDCSLLRRPCRRRSLTDLNPRFAPLATLNSPPLIVVS